MSRFVVPEDGHVVCVIPATASAGAADYTGDYVNLKYYDHVDFIVSFGSVASTSTIICYESNNAAGGSTTAIAVDYYAETTDTGDTLADRATGSTAGIATSGNDRVFYVLPLDAAQLTDGYTYVSLHVNVAGANSVCAIAVLSGARYAQENSLTAIT